uniref:CSON015469 protein n=1 Tax=Culicoides sonorensis TaxID=179676 RepID=A0A336MEC2_CULSO
MKFVIATVFCLFAAQALAYPYVDNYEYDQEFESAVGEAQEEESVRVERNVYGHQAHGGYGHQAHGGYGHQHVHPVQHKVHAYAAHPPKVDCGSNLLVGCLPQVAKVPCVPNHGHGGYHKAAPAHYAAPKHMEHAHYAPAPKHEAHGYKASADAAEW